MSFISSALHAEAEACRACLIFALQHGWDDIILESDCSMLVAALKGSEDNLSNMGCIIGDCKSYLRAFSSIDICHIFREANGVAHRLAHIASSSFTNEFWLEETPSIIEDVLLDDVCNRTRG